MNQYILVHASIYSNFLHSNSLISRYSIHQGTRQYNEVPKSPVPLNKEVQRNTSRYKALYLYSLVQGYRTFGYFIVLPCTVMYRVKRNQGIAVSEIRVNAVMYQYVLVHTSSY
jgi:hypothetical protein